MRDINHDRPACAHGAYIDSEDCHLCKLGPKWWESTAHVIKEQERRVAEQESRDKNLCEAHYREHYEAAMSELRDARKTIDGLLATVAKLKKEPPHA